jgi:hypothetical protein
LPRRDGNVRRGGTTDEKPGALMQGQRTPFGGTSPPGVDLGPLPPAEPPAAPERSTGCVSYHTPEGAVTGHEPGSHLEAIPRRPPDEFGWTIPARRTGGRLSSRCLARRTCPPRKPGIALRARCHQGNQRNGNGRSRTHGTSDIEPLLASLFKLPRWPPRSIRHHGPPLVTASPPTV